MTRVLPFVVLAAAALIGVGAWQGSRTPDEPSAPAIETLSRIAATTAPALPSNVAEQVRVALDRPLFSAGRRPSMVAPLKPSAAPSPPRLTALLAGPFGRRAIFVLADHRSVTVDEAKGARTTLGDWTVLAIGVASVVVAGPDGERTLVLGPGQPPPAPPLPEAADPHEAALPIALPKAGPVARGTDQLPFPLR